MNRFSKLVRSEFQHRQRQSSKLTVRNFLRSFGVRAEPLRGSKEVLEATIFIVFLFGLVFLSGFQPHL